VRFIISQNDKKSENNEKTLKGIHGVLNRFEG